MRRFECREPQANGRAKRGERHTGKRFGIRVEAAQRRPQQGNASQAIAAVEMVERGCDLNQSLQESLLRALRSEPDRFPMFVRLEERAGMEAAQAFL